MKIIGNKKKMVLISIIMNTYNDQENHLRKAIEGYQNQKIPCELIISTIYDDPAIKTATEMGVKKIIFNKNSGICNQLNKALENVEGQWFCYASGNDFALPNKLIDEHSLLFKTRKKVCYSAFHSGDKNLKITGTYRFHPYNYAKHKIGNFIIDNAMTNMKILRKYLPFREEVGNYLFWDMWLTIYENEGNVFFYNPIPNFIYRLDGMGRHFKKKKDKALWNFDERHKTHMLKLHGIKYKPRLK